MTKGVVSKAEFVLGLTDPTLARPRGKGIHLNLIISDGFADWDCPVCDKHNHQKWFGRDFHVCSNCEQPTELKGEIQPIKIDTTNTEKWARTWVEKARAELPTYKARFTYTDFLADFFVGDLPWSENENAAVLFLIPQQPGFEDLLKEYEAAFMNDYLAKNFGRA